MLYQEEKRPAGHTPLMKALLAAGGVVLGFALCRLFLLPVPVTDSSMGPGLSPGDRVIALRHVTPRRGDVAVFDSPSRDDRVLLRRVIAAEGDTVEVRDKVIYVNNSRARFSWNVKTGDGRVFPMRFTGRDTMPPVRLKRKEFFMLCDTLDRGYDSRVFGVVRGEALRGRMLFKF